MPTTKEVKDGEEEKSVLATPTQLKELILATNKEIIDDVADLKKEKEQSKTKEVKIAKVENSEKSIMSTDGRKFISLGKETKDFVEQFKSLIGQKTYNEGTDEDGGVTVPEELKNAILDYESEGAIVRPRAMVTTVSTGKMKIMLTNPDSDGVNLYGVTFTHDDEQATQPADQKIPVSSMTFSVNKIRGFCSFTDELLKDSVVNFANEMLTRFRKALVYYEDYLFLQGSGVSRPLGIVADTGIQVVKRAVIGEISYDDTIDMFYSLKSNFRVKGIWLGSTGAVKEVMKLKDLNGLPIFATSMREGQPSLMLGKPFFETDKLSDLGVKGDLIFVDFSQYQILDQGGMTLSNNPFSRWGEDITEYKLVTRIDAKMIYKEGAVILDIPAV